MCRFLPASGWLLALALVAPARADTSTDPLRLVPDAADLIIKIGQPRKLVDIPLNNPLFKQFQTLEAVREFYESTNFRRGQQMLAYFEKYLGVNRLDLVDRLAGGGAVVAAKLGPDPAPVLLVIQGKDEQLTRKFLTLALQVVDQELARQESKERLERSSYRGLETYHIGKGLYAAAVGSALLLSNMDKSLHAALDLHLDGSKKSLLQSARVAEARKLLEPTPLAWFWLNMDTVRKAPAAKDVFTLPRNDAVLTVVFGNLLDLGTRAPFISAGIYPENEGLLISVRVPAGREGMTPALAVHVPPANQAGSRPLLEPKGVLYSSSYFLDLAQFWEQRSKLFNAAQVKVFEDFNKNSKNFLAGSEFNKLVAQAGSYQRLVAVPQFKSSYKTTPVQRIPAFGLAIEMREPDRFGKGLNAILRSVAFLASFQVKLKTVEERHGPVTIVGYRFSEDDSYPADVDNYRFNFSPSFAVVGNQFVASSTMELCRELVDLLQLESKESVKSSPATVRSRLYGTGGADLLETFKDRLFAQTMLDQAMSPAKANEQVNALLDWVRTLGVIQLEQNYNAKDYRFDIRVAPVVAKSQQAAK